MKLTSIFSASIFAAVLGLSSLSVVAEEGEWIQDQNGCKHFNPHPQVDEKINLERRMQRWLRRR